jgi:hypothetical protein
LINQKTEKSMLRRTIPNLNNRIIGLFGVCLALFLAGCGGGGGDPGSSNSTAVASRYNVALVTRPATSVFYGGSNTTAYVTLTKTCSGESCGSLPTEAVVGQVVTFSSNDPSAVIFNPTSVITDSEGKAQVSVSAASRSASAQINITATVSISGINYSRTVALNVNNQVNRTLSAEDHNTSQVLDTSTDCSNYPTFIVNVKDRLGNIQENSEITVDSINFNGAGDPLIEAAAQDLGVFTDLGRVWVLQVRPPNPPSAQCSESGQTTQVGEVIFNVEPGDGSAAYKVGYELKYFTQ